MYGDKVYRYLYEETTVVEQNDWSVISLQGYNCLTLSSCTPIGVSDHRIIVRARLEKVLEYSEDFEFASGE